MRKLLLLSTALLASLTAFSLEPKIYRDTYVLAVSPDAKFVASDNDGTVKVINIETGDTQTFPGESVMGYSLGLGRPISDDGTIVGTNGNLPAYLKDGVWHNLPTPYPENYNLANSITPDGSRICGCIGAQSFSAEDTPTPMEIPVVWNRLDDGTYGDPVLLPYPAKDYTGRVPLYVMAVAISDDGNTVAGQMQDYSGFMTTLVFYTFDNGEWTMHNDFARLANPAGIEIPPYPGDEPVCPSIYDFMTPEEKAAYEAAIAAWEAGGTWDYSTYPKEEDYMSPLEVQDYYAAWTQYQNEHDAWEQQLIAYGNAIQACNGQSLILNNVLLSPDGKTAVSTGILYYAPPADSMMERKSFTPVKFNLVDGTYTMFPDKGMNASYLAADGSILAFDGGVYKPRQAWVYPPEETETPLSMLEYFEGRDPDTANWMKENMLHSVVVYDAETGDQKTENNFECTGTPCASPDMRIIVCSTENLWDNTGEMLSYLLPDNSEGAVKDINCPGGTSRLQIFTLDGRKVLDSHDQDHISLPHGIYIVKQSGEEGATVRKVAI